MTRKVRREEVDTLLAKVIKRTRSAFDQDTRSAGTRSAVADGRVNTDSLTPVLHRFILIRFSLQCYISAHN
jgi:hypothetical protein